MRKIVLFVSFLFVLSSLGCLKQPNGNGQNITVQNGTQNNTILLNGTNVSVEPPPTPTIGHVNFVCRLVGHEQTDSIGMYGTDLGTGVITERNGSRKIWIFFGDVVGVDDSTWGASAWAESPIPFNCNEINWKTRRGRYFQPLESTRIKGVDDSTVPSGAVEINGSMYLFAQRITAWGENFNPLSSHGYGVLFKENEQGNFEESEAKWALDEKHLNTAPVLGKLEGKNAVFMAISGKYRDSPVYLAYVMPENIENMAAYKYLVELDEQGYPVWTSNIAQAKPIEGLENVKAGELSFVYNAKLEKYYLMFQSYDNYMINRGFLLLVSEKPYGPFSEPARFSPCGGIGNRPNWFEQGWQGCYGGYIMPESFGDDGHDLYFTLSIWNPYTTVVLKTRVE